MVAFCPKPPILTADMPLVPVSLDWVLELMLEPRGRREFAEWGTGVALEAD